MTESEALRMKHDGLRVTKSDGLRMAGCSWFVILRETKDLYLDQGVILPLRYAQGSE